MNILACYIHYETYLSYLSSLKVEGEEICDDVETLSHNAHEPRANNSSTILTVTCGHVLQSNKAVSYKRVG